MLMISFNCLSQKRKKSVEQCGCVIIPERINLKTVLLYLRKRDSVKQILLELDCFSTSVFSMASLCVPGSQEHEVEVIFVTAFLFVKGFPVFIGKITYSTEKTRQYKNPQHMLTKHSL